VFFGVLFLRFMTYVSQDSFIGQIHIFLNLNLPCGANKTRTRPGRWEVTDNKRMRELQDSVEMREELEAEVFTWFIKSVLDVL
jgi:hypothetical protein